MKINPNIASGLYDAYRKVPVKGQADVPASAAVERGDKVELSNEAQRMQTLRSQMANASEDGRAARVETLRQQVQTGTYKVDIRALADKLNDSGILDR